MSMRTLIACLLALSLLTSAQARVCQYSKSGARFVIAVEGVEGGIAPQEAKLSVMVLRKPDGSAVVLTRRPGGDVKRGVLKSYDEFVAKLKPVWELPQEEIPGTSDPYGLAEALHVHGQGTCWQNSPPTGCVRCKPTITPSAAERAAFASAVKLVLALDAVATTKADDDAWLEGWKTIGG